MKGITIPTISMPVISMPSIGVPWIGVPDSGKKGLAWPSGMKEAIKAVYDPKKQGMTNYDVIEAYIEDFTTWAKNGNVTSAVTVNNNSITINGSISGASIYKRSNMFMQNMDIIANGIGDGDNVEYRCVKDGVLQYIPIVNGVNKLPASELTENPDFTIGIVLNVVSTGVITLKQLPTSVLQDLSGNGNHAYLYGGKGKLNSGMGVYQLDMTNAENLAFDDFERFANKVIARGIYKGNYSVFGQVTDNSNIPIEKTITLKVKGVVNLDTPLVIEYGYFLSTGIYHGNKLLISEDGTYTYTFKDLELPEGALIDYIYYNRCYFGNGKTFNVDEIVIEEIPDYPDQLCYDGKMYAVCYGFPILTDYTVMADRTWLDKSGGCFAGKRQPDDKGAFVFEKIIPTGNVCYSFGLSTSIDFVESGISWQTATSYNGQTVNKGNTTDTDFLLIGGGLYYPEQDLFSELYVGCHGKIIVAGRSFTEEEINWLKQNWDKI